MNIHNAATILQHHGQQYIPDLSKASLKPPFRGRPVITASKGDVKKVCESCPMGAIASAPLSIDLGCCSFCGECSRLFPERIQFTQDHRLASNTRENLIVKEGNDSPIAFVASAVRKEITSLLGRALKLRQISAGGDCSAELELGASGNPNFDMGRYGIEFVASPRHADGIVITGPISANMAEATRICHESVPTPRIVILCGVDAISGGLYAKSKGVDRSFLDEVKVDLYVPGDPPHPLTFISGVLALLGR